MSTTYRKLRAAVVSVVLAEDNLEVAQTRLAVCEQRLGFALRDCRMYRELSLRQVAKVLGVSAPYLADVENGRRHISDDNLESLMNILVKSRHFNPPTERPKP